MEPLSAAERNTAARLFGELFPQISGIGLAADGSTTRLAWTEEATAAASWFERTAHDLGLQTVTDVNGNQWAFTQDPVTIGPATGSPTAASPATVGSTTAGSAPAGPATAASTGAIVTGSHLDSVANGGRYDGALGVLVGLIAVHILSRREPQPAQPLGVVAFADEEGGRFQTPTFGSRALIGVLPLADSLEHTDAAGVTLAQALRGAGLDPERMGRDQQALDRIAAMIEVHIEQEYTLAKLGQPLALGTQLLPHGRWRFEFDGESGHAGTTPIDARHDPMLPLAAAVDAARAAAIREHGFATIGKLEVFPNVTNCIAGSVRCWLDARASDSEAALRIVEAVRAAAGTAADEHGVRLTVTQESLAPAVHFDAALRERIAATFETIGLTDVPMETGAGHDVAAVSAERPTALIFVRSANGASHCADELASDDDCVTAIAALSAVIADLAANPLTPTASRA
jgi:N-carbamoyl-L-amino-acid hydrolase